MQRGLSAAEPRRDVSPQFVQNRIARYCQIEMATTITLHTTNAGKGKPSAAANNRTPASVAMRSNGRARFLSSTLRVPNRIAPLVSPMTAFAIKIVITYRDIRNPPCPASLSLRGNSSRVVVNSARNCAKQVNIPSAGDSTDGKILLLPLRNLMETVVGMDESQFGRFQSTSRMECQGRVRLMQP